MSYSETTEKKDLPPGQMKRVDVGHHEILIANVEGNIYATCDRCGHMNGSLSKGKLDGKIVECPLHKVHYDVTSGKCVNKPQMGGLEGVFMAATGTGRIAGNIDTLDINTYKTKIIDGLIMVEIPQNELARQ